MEPKITERELRKLLLSRKPEDAARLYQWRRDAAPEEVIKTYETVANFTGDFPFAGPLLMLAVNLPNAMRFFVKEVGETVLLEFICLFLAMTSIVIILAGVRRSGIASRNAAKWLICQGERKALKPMANLWRPLQRDDTTEASNVAFQAFLSRLPGQSPTPTRARPCGR